MTLADATCAAIESCACRRCRGLLVWEPFPFKYGLRYNLGSWRCFACGEFCSPDMLANRRQMPAVLQH